MGGIEYRWNWESKSN